MTETVAERLERKWRNNEPFTEQDFEDAKVYGWE
jgi:hypothetical protein